MTIRATTIVIQDEEPITSKLDEEVVMLSAREQSYFGLGEIGSVIWNMIVRPRRVSDICAELVRTYDVEPSACERDVIAFCNQLLQHRLIRVVEDEHPP